MLWMKDFLIYFSLLMMVVSCLLLAYIGVSLASYKDLTHKSNRQKIKYVRLTLASRGKDARRLIYADNAMQVCGMLMLISYFGSFIFQSFHL